MELPSYSDEEANASAGDDQLQSVKEEAAVTPGASQEQPPHLHPSRSHIHPDLPVKRSKEKPRRADRADSDGRPAKKQKTSKTEDKEESTQATEPTVRDLMRQAYSRSTLHTYKSDPFKKRHDRKGGDQKQAQTGKGQPNMKLRMNAMLAKIKRDFAS